MRVFDVIIENEEGVKTLGPFEEPVAADKVWTCFINCGFLLLNHRPCNQSLPVGDRLNCFKRFEPTNSGKPKSFRYEFDGTLVDVKMRERA